MRKFFHLFILKFVIISVLMQVSLFSDVDSPIIYGIVPDTPPIAYVDQNGNPTGFLVELFSNIMNELGIDYEIVAEPYSDIYTKLIYGEVDLFTSMIKTEKREELFYFPESSMSGGWGQLFINLESEHDSILSLSNKKIGLVKSDEIGQNFKLFMDQLGIPFIPIEFDTFQQMVSTVQSGEIYGGVIYSAYLLNVDNIKITPTVFSPQPAYPVTALNNDFIPLLDLIMVRLEELRADENSYFYKLQNKWLVKNDNVQSQYFSIIILALLILIAASAFLVLNSLYLKRRIRHRTGELEQAAIIFDHNIEGIMVTDSTLNIIKVNSAFEKITGYKSREVIGQSVEILKAPDEYPDLMKEVKNSLDKTGKWIGETWDRRKNGEIYPQHKSIVVIKNEMGDVSNYSFVFSDLTESKDLEERIHYISNYDKQTDLPNKTLFMDRLIMSGINADREGKILCVISLGIDNFKKINRSYGHQVVKVKLTPY